MVIFFSIPNTVLAHKINISSWFRNDILCIESSFDSGLKVNKGKVIVFDSNEQIIFSGNTDKDGYTECKLTKIDDLKIVLSTKCGHKNFLIIPKNKIYIENIFSDDKKNMYLNTEISLKRNPITLEQIEAIFSNQLKTNLEPINKALSNSNQKIELKDIFGGVGYILGLIGIGTYFKYIRIKE
jgi:nickel transport protein